MTLGALVNFSAQRRELNRHDWDFELRPGTCQTQVRGFAFNGSL